MTNSRLVRLGPVLAALALSATSGASRADTSWIRLGNAQNPSAAYVENHNGADLSTKYQQSMGKACYQACPLVELRMRALQNPSGVAGAQTSSTMLYSLAQPNGKPLTPGELFALGSVVFRFKVVGKHGMPPLGSVSFNHTVLVSPLGSLSPAGRVYQGSNEATATGFNGQSSLSKYKLDVAQPKTTVSASQAEMNGVNFSVEVPATSSGWLDWSVAGQVQGGSPASSDYKIVLKDVLYTGAGVPNAGVLLGEGGTSWYQLMPKTPGGSD
ncbi:hypothetical protein [Ideonella sp.]|uniref:hypothetical protein n=1 Tax=Ideonella sp. TaxID=1929293 RepID=UPI003BB5D88A